ncbi:MAG TPA: type III-B CRISPR module-associated Cmr3 family protein [Nevskiaceae bacterium]
METTHHVFLEPLDVLFLRGNKSFGDPGSFGASFIPPWPSVAAGALRSRLYADGALDVAALQDPAQFTLTAFNLARRNDQGEVERLHALPADLVVQGEAAERKLRAMHPRALAADISCSATLPQVPLLAEDATRQKASIGWWLTDGGWARYLAGQLPALAQLVKSDELWKTDIRIGVGIAHDTRRADDGKLFTTQAMALHKRCDVNATAIVGFAATARCAALPNSGLVRLGGDGRAATIHPCRAPDSAKLKPGTGGRFKLVLTTPGIFPSGWRPPGVDDADVWHGPQGCTARLVCAAVPRCQTVSGWDLAHWHPKDAQRAAPTGSVYWFEDFSGNPAALEMLVETGLWGLAGQTNDAQRQAEGFNRCAVGTWS